MPFLSDTALLNFSPENPAGTFNTAVTTAQPKVRVKTATMSFTAEVSEDSNFLSGDFASNDLGTIGAKLATVDVEMNLTPGEFVASPISHKMTYADLFKGCSIAMIGVGVGGVDAIAGKYAFYPASANSCNSLSFARFLRQSCGSATDGFREDVRGAMGNFTIDITGRAGAWASKFSYQGMAVGTTDVLVGAIPLFDDDEAMSVLPESFINTSIEILDLSVDGATAKAFCVSKMNFDAGNTVSDVECQANDSGIVSKLITAMKPTITLDPLLQSKAYFDQWTGVSTGHVYQIKIESPTFQLFIPRAQMVSAPVADANGYMRTELKFNILRNTEETLPVGVTGTIANKKEAMWFLVIDEIAPQY